MNPRIRLMSCRLIEQMEKKIEYSKEIGLVDKSLYRGKPVKRKDSKEEKNSE